MIKCKDGNVEMEGNPFELISESMEVMVSVIEPLVEHDSLDAEDIPTVLEVITSALYRETQPLMNKK